LKLVEEMLLSVLQTYAAIILIFSLLLKCCLPTTLYTYSYNCSQHSWTNKLLLDKCDLTKLLLRVTQQTKECFPHG
jgi:hypothetical protein